MSIKMRTHACSEDAPAHWGVMVIDLSEAEPKAELIGNIIESYNESYSNPDHRFDLSKYIGKEVVIAIGIYRWETGDYWKQLVLRRITFAKELPSEWGYLPGEASTMPVTEVSEFIGISPDPRVDEDGPQMYRDA